jgi:hypothetical protein
VFELKPFQKETIKKLADFLEAARFDGRRTAFENTPKEVPSEWRKSYVTLEKLAETPCACLRVLTGGGKTFLAAQAVKVGGEVPGAGEQSTGVVADADGCLTAADVGDTVQSEAPETGIAQH